MASPKTTNTNRYLTPGSHIQERSLDTETFDFWGNRGTSLGSPIHIPFLCFKEGLAYFFPPMIRAGTAIQVIFCGHFPRITALDFRADCHTSSSSDCASSRRWDLRSSSGPGISPCEQSRRISLRNPNVVDTTHSGKAQAAAYMYIYIGALLCLALNPKESSL